MRHSADRDQSQMRIALRLAERAYGQTSPNPLVGALIEKNGRVIGRGWHRKAGSPHAEINALQDAAKRGESPRGGTLYVTLEPCCTHGRTPPCTDAIIKAGIRRVVIGATDPNPLHAGRGISILRRAGIEVNEGVLADAASEMNRCFNHWIVARTPFVTVKAAMSIDGKIATRTGESKWITGPGSRRMAMHMRRGSDAILAGVNTVIADNPSLTVRDAKGCCAKHQPLRIILDSEARTPPGSQVTSDEHAAKTIIVVTDKAPKTRVTSLACRTTIWQAPKQSAGIDLKWLLARLGEENVTSLLVEGGGEVNSSFLLGGHAHRILFFFAPKVIGGREARKGVAGTGIAQVEDAIRLSHINWRLTGEDLLLTADVERR